MLDDPSPTRLPASLALADAFDAEGKLDEALASYESATRIDPSCVTAWYRIALLQMSFARFDAAETALHRCLAADPGNAWAHFQLGTIAASSQRHMAALAAFESAHALDGTTPEFLVNVANMRLALGQLDAAVATLRPLGEALPGWWAQVRDDALRQRQGARAEALELLRRRGRLDRDAALSLARLLVRLGRVTAAVRLVAVLTDNAPNDFGPIGVHTAALLRRDGLDAAIAFLVGRKKFEGQPDYHRQLAGLLFEAGDFDRALEHDRRAATPGPAGLRARGMALLAAGEWAELTELGAAWMQTTDDTLPYRFVLRGLGIGRSRRAGDARAGGGQIPRKVVQFWADSNPPADVAATMASWPRGNPGYAHAVYDDERAAALILERHGRRAADAFAVCHHPAMRSDFFRVCYLISEGGFYIDADDRCARSLEPFRRTLGDAGFMAALSPDIAPYVYNAFIAAAPGNSILAATLDDMTEGIERHHAQGVRPDVWHSTGPGALTRAVARWSVDPTSAPGDAVFVTARHYRSIAPEANLAYKTSAAANWRLS